MNTKYVKVSTADRLPETAGYYYAFRDDIGQNIVRYTSEGKWFLPENTIHRVTHWLEEKTDYEEEILQNYSEKKLIKYSNLLLN